MLYGVAVTLATGFAASHVKAMGPLGLEAATGWSAAAVVAALLMATRGHEKKLIASYVTQGNWMKLHRSELLKRYELVSRDDEWHRFGCGTEA